MLDDSRARAKRLRDILQSKNLRFLMEVHNGLSAKIAEEAGFEGLWGSGLSISAAMGVRDNNEASWTQVLEVLEFIHDATSVPLLFDGDTGYGNFNNMRRLVRKLEQRGVAGVCIEDKLFPKTNSFIGGERQPLADIGEFAGKIRAGKDTQQDPDFCIVARVEALIAGWGMGEALKRAEAYHGAGADAILIHSKLSRPDEILEFKKEWGDRCPVVIVPTRYYSTPTEVFRQAGFSVVIWANHLLRSSLSAMEQTARQIKTEETLLNVEDRIASLAKVFRLQGADELEEAEKRYLPGVGETTKALILAASRGKEFGLGPLTEDRPKALIPISGRPLLYRMVDALNQIGIKEITVVRGYKKEMIAAPNLRYVDNDEYENTLEVYSFFKGIEGLVGKILVTYGDVLYNKYIPMNLLESDAEFCIAVDSSWEESRNRNRYAAFVSCDHPYRKEDFYQEVTLQAMGPDLSESVIHGEWMGLFKLSSSGLSYLQEMLASMANTDELKLKQMHMPDLFNKLSQRGKRIQVIYTSGHWLDVDDLKDLSDASAFQGAS
ncbi:MAG: phosphoenolpyruvate mutase [Dehalococcoidia bacterium]